MKRTDLVKGEAYYYSASNSRWMEYAHEGSKVIVVDTDCWHQPRGYGRDLPVPRKTIGGTGVLVDMVVKPFNPGGEERIVRTVIKTPTIRGLYEETKREVEERSEARSEQFRLAQEATKKINDETDAAISLAKDNGVKLIRQNGYGSREVVINAAELTRLILGAEGNL